MEKSRATPSYELRTCYVQTFKRGLMARDRLFRVVASKPVIRWIFSNLVAVNAAHVQVALMCRKCASYCHTSYMCNMYATCVRDICCLHTCMLQVCCTSVSCMYAYYYSAAYMPLAPMQASSVPHMCSLHTCILLQC